MDLHDVMTFISVTRDGLIRMTLTHTIASVTVIGTGADKQVLKDKLLLDLESAIEVKNAKVKTFT